MKKTTKAGRPKKPAARTQKKLTRRSRKNVLPKNLMTEEQIGPPRCELCCEWCGEAISSGIVRVHGQTLRVHPNEVKMLDEQKVPRPGQRIACRNCNKVTDLILKINQYE